MPIPLLIQMFSQRCVGGAFPSYNPNGLPVAHHQNKENEGRKREGLLIPP